MHPINDFGFVLIDLDRRGATLANLAVPKRYVAYRTSRLLVGPSSISRSFLDPDSFHVSDRRQDRHDQLTDPSRNRLVGNIEQQVFATFPLGQLGGTGHAGVGENLHTPFVDAAGAGEALDDIGLNLQGRTV